MKDDVILFSDWLAHFRPNVKAVIAHSDKEIFVYLKTGKIKSIPKLFAGIPVITKRAGKIAPGLKPLI